jgi:uncharacterized protein YbjT (DUF2867 family)
MSNALHWSGSIAAQGMVYAPYGEGRSALIDPADIAAVAAIALTTDGHDGQAYALTGPEAIGIGDQVEILARELGRPLRFVPVPPEAAMDGMRRAGMPETTADAALQTMAIALEPHASKVEPTVEELTGRPARSFATWVHAHRVAFS